MTYRRTLSTAGKFWLAYYAAILAAAVFCALVR